MRRELRTVGLAAGLLGAGVAAPQTPAEIQRSYESAARQASPAFGSFSVQRGEAFFKSTHGGDWSCASCHTQRPVAAGRHAVTGKTIAPLAPAASPARFTESAKVEKWFNRNCNDVLKRTCTPAEKGDVLAYLMSLK
jgi:mono/diheme cytochrome c family protein